MPSKILSKVFFLSPAVNGGDPVSISYIRASKDHQSTALPWPFQVNISGAMYSIVPQKLKSRQCIATLIICRKLFKGGNYMRKYGNNVDKQILNLRVCYGSFVN